MKWRFQRWENRHLCTVQKNCLEKDLEYSICMYCILNRAHDQALILRSSHPNAQ